MSYSSLPQKTFKTKAGTDLPLLNLKGKDYLRVAHRVLWFREEHPNWTISTEFVGVNEKAALAKATISNEVGRIMAIAHKYEDLQDFRDYREKAETGSIGRALALVGYGTQFCAHELDEGERIVDAPQGQNEVINHALLPFKPTNDFTEFENSSFDDLSGGSPKTMKQGVSSPGKRANSEKGTVISTAQAKRLYAISQSANWTPQEMKDLLQHWGYESSKDIGWKDYDQIVKEVESHPRSDAH